MLVLSIWWFCNRIRTEMAKNKPSGSEVNKAEYEPVENKPQPFSYAPPHLAYELEQKTIVPELQDYREPVEM
jgi:hypothetical protein